MDPPHKWPVGPVSQMDSLIKCVNHGTLNDLQQLMATKKIPVDLNDRNGWTPIHHAAFKGRVLMLKALLESARSRSRKKHLTNLRAWQNETPLWVACSASKVSYDVVNILLANAANPNIGNLNHETPLHVVCRQKGMIEVVKLLVENGACPNAQDNKDGFTPLMDAIYEAKDLQVAKYLKDKTNPFLTNHEGQDVLSLAIAFLPRAVPHLVETMTPTNKHIFDMLRRGHRSQYLASAPHCAGDSSFIIHRSGLRNSENEDEDEFRAVKEDLLTPLHFCLKEPAEFELVLHSLPKTFLSFFESHALDSNFLPPCIVAGSKSPHYIMQAYLRYNASIGREQQMPSGTLYNLDEREKNVLRKYLIIEENYEHNSLKSACRIAFRKAIRSQFSDDWSAYCWLRDCLLPVALKKYLFFKT